MHMPDFCVSNAEFGSAKAMRMNRDSRPSRNYVLERFYVFHHMFSVPPLSMSEPTHSIQLAICHNAPHTLTKVSCFAFAALWDAWKKPFKNPLNGANCHHRDRELGRLSLIANANLGRSLYWGRRYHPAIAQAKRAVELNPKFGVALV
jgi:hypothetical protein